MKGQHEKIEMQIEIKMMKILEEKNVCVYIVKR